MDVEQLIGSVIQGALGGKRKKSRGVTHFLTGGKSSFLNASTLLAWAAETTRVLLTHDVLR